MKVGKAIYNILSKSTDVHSNFPYNNTDYSPTGTELVENGEFDQLGTDVITNGSFATDTDWTKGNGWSIAGKAISTQALGSEEVTNGDFSAAGINLVDNPNFTDTGSELVTDGDFPSGTTAWSFGSGWSLGTDEAVCVANGGFDALNQGSVMNSGSSYKVTYTADLSLITSGTLKLGTFSNSATERTVLDGTNTVYLTANGGTFQVNEGGAVGTATITNISVKELGADWTILEDTCTFGENGLTMTSTEGTDLRIRTGAILADTTSYKVTYTIHAVGLTGTNAIQYYTGSALNSYDDLPEQGVGTHTFYYTTPSSTNNNWYFRLDLRGGSTSTTDFVTISSISVQELGEDWTEFSGDPDSVSFGENGVTLVQSSDLGSYSRVTQSSVTSADKSYKVTYTIFDSAYTSGNKVQYLNGTGYTDLPEQGAGTHTFYYTRLGTNDTWYFNLSTPTPSVTDFVTISNISVKEIATSYLTQAVSLSAKTWKIIYSVSDYIAGSVSATDYGAVTTANAVGITEYVEIGVASDFRMVNIDGYFQGAVTDISAQLVDPNGYWTLGSGWSFGDDVAISDGSAGSITQSILTANTSYKITVKVTGNPTLLVFSSTSFYGDEATRTLKNGTHTYYLQAKAATFSITNEGGDACTITNISVQEVVLNKIFPELAPPDIDAPYIVYSVVSNSPSETKNNNGDIDTASIEVYGFQDTYNKAVDLGVSVRAALDRKTGTYNTIEIQSTNYVNEQMDVNEARKLWAAIQDYSIRIKNL